MDPDAIQIDCFELRYQEAKNSTIMHCLRRYDAIIIGAHPHRIKDATDTLEAHIKNMDLPIKLITCCRNGQLCSINQASLKSAISQMLAS